MTILVAAVAGALTFAAALVVMTTERRVKLHRQLGHYVGASAARESRRRRLANARLAEVLESVLERVGLRDRFAIALDRAGVDATPGAAASAVVLASGALFLVGLLWSGVGRGVLLGALPPAGAVVLLLLVAGRRSRGFEAQLPELLDNLAASLRAGHSFDQALQTLATDIGEPAGREFRRVVAEVHLGRPLDVALADLGRRIGSKDLLFVLEAISVQRQVGGSLAELFALVADTVRQREQFRRKLKAITALPRASARVLTGLPVAAALVLSAINHSYMAPLWHTSTGRLMLELTASMVVVGSVLLRRVGTVKP
ncbi:MAG TPA: type II secretion system F family protein [Gaiellaceae bacterium]|jgi:tight adherence protein B